MGLVVSNSGGRKGGHEEQMEEDAKDNEQKVVYQTTVRQDGVKRPGSILIKGPKGDGSKKTPCFISFSLCSIPEKGRFIHHYTITYTIIKIKIVTYVHR